MWSRDFVGWSLSFLAGGVWGVALFSWGLPLPVPARIVATALLLAALAAASPAGAYAAAGFAMGLGATSFTLLVSTGDVRSSWMLVPLTAFAAGLVLVASALNSRGEPS